jgi:hypothetical protein
MISKILEWDSKYSHLSLWLSGLIIITLGIFQWFLPRSFDLFSADAYSYINFQATRTIGYPYFLWMVKTLTGTFEPVALIQHLFFGLTLWYLCYRFSVFLGSLVAGLALALGIMGLREIVVFNFQIFTESLSISFLFLLASVLMNHLQSARSLDFIKIGTIMGLLILIRPSFYFLTGLLPFLIWFNRENWKPVTINLGLPIFVFYLIGSAANYAHHGFFSTQSFLGNNLYGKVALIVEEGITSQDPLENKLLEHMATTAKPFQDSLGTITDERIFFSMASPFYDAFRFFMYTQTKEKFPEISHQPDEDKFCRDVALKVISQKPWDYVKDVVMNYRALWFVWELRNSNEEKELKNAIEMLRELDHFKEVKLDYDYVKFRGKSYPMVLGARILFFLGFWSSTLFIIGFLVRPKNYPLYAIFPLYLSLLCHGSYLSTALVQAGLARYAMIMWPYMMILVISVFYGIIKKFYISRN